MHLISKLLIVVGAVGATSLAWSQAASEPAGWPRAAPLPAVLPTASPGTTTTITLPPPPKLEKEYLEKRFRLVGGQVYDAKADLTWQRCDHGQTWDEGNAWCRGSKKHLAVEAMVEDVRARAPGWRLPEVGELAGMLEVACQQSAKDTPQIFPEVDRNTNYLTASPHSNPDSHMSAQCFGGRSMTSGLSKKYVSIARLVRSGPPTQEP
jgi:hypothetical protein